MSNYVPQGTGPTRAQVGYIRGLADDLGWDDRRLEAEERKFTGGRSLTGKTAAMLVKELRARLRRERPRSPRWE